MERDKSENAEERKLETHDPFGSFNTPSSALSESDGVDERFPQSFPGANSLSIAPNSVSDSGWSLSLFYRFWMER
jgi:hypothetical protein